MRVRLITAVVVAALSGAAVLHEARAYDYTAPVPLHAIANFDPANGVVPFPNNLLLQGTTDLTLNIPIADPTAPSAGPTLAMNALDGFSTVAPWTVTFSAPIDASSLAAGASVRLFEVSLSGPGGAVTGVVRELSSDEFAVAVAPSDTSGRTLAILPTRPLQQLTSYMAVVTTDVKTSDGDAVRPSLIYALAEGTNALCANGHSTLAFLGDDQACQLEPLRQLTNAQEAAAAAAGVAPGSIALSWVATTQSITVSLQAIESVVEQSAPATTRVVPTGMDLGDLGRGLPPVADIYVGTIDLPYYLSAPSADDPTAPLTGYWHAAPGAYLPPFDQAGLDPTSTNVTFANPLPVATSAQTVPLLMTLPNAASGKTKPASGWPVVIFQHGITRNRTDMLAIAGTLAAQGYAVVAIDLPLHGVTDPTSPFYVGNTPFAALGAKERTFDLDVEDNATGAAGADGVVDPSGSHFINLSSLLTSRDNLREGAADLLELAHAIPSIDGLDGSRIRFVGQSLGSIVGAVFLAVDPDVTTAVLNVPGGGIAELLAGSPTFGPQINAGLAQAGLAPGTPDYDQFLLAAQTAIDSGDPINYAGNGTLLAPSDSADGAPPAKHLLVQEVVGDADHLPDQVIPNTVAGAPLSGTEPLIAALGLEPIDSTTQSADGVSGVVRFLQGEHGSILDPTDYPATTAEMQGEMASFIASGGTTVVVQNPSIVAPAPSGD
ncbi:MAG TPA: Ig-like domain-containing protein [Dokdonella sp.]